METMAKDAVEQEVCKKKVLYIGSNFQAEAFRPPPPLPHYYMQYSKVTGQKRFKEIFRH